MLNLRQKRIEGYSCIHDLMNTDSSFKSWSYSVYYSICKGPL